MVLAYIDTNVFLDFYQSSTDRLAVFQDVVPRATHVLLTEQTVNEFKRNRIARLTQLAENVRKGSHGQLHTTAVVQALPGFKKWTAARDATKAAADEIVKDLTSWVTDEQSDPVLTAFQQLVAAANFIPTSSQLIERARIRKLLGQPPTSPDKHSVGDELNWECLLTWNKTDLVIVTRDKTYLNNQALLKAEFSNATGKALTLITESLSAALEQIGQASETVTKAERDLPVKDDDFPWDGACPKCGGILGEAGYEGSDGDSAWWLECGKCHSSFFPPAKPTPR